MRRTPRGKAPTDHALDRELTSAYHDARALALELGCGQPSTAIDAMALGVVLLPGEASYRRVSSWLSHFKYGTWGQPVPTDILITNRRLLCRLPHSQLASLPWTGLVGLEIDLGNASVVLDHGDGHPVCVSGPTSATLAVAAVAFLYGIHALLRHPALAPLRTVAGDGPDDQPPNDVGVLSCVLTEGSRLCPRPLRAL
jgi:hypothetical protein